MFKNLSIKSRLIFIISFLSVLLLAIGAFGLTGMSKANEGMRATYEEYLLPLEKVETIQAKLLKNRLYIAICLVTPTPEVIKERTGQVEQNIADITRIWDTFTETPQSATEKKLSDKFAEDRKIFVTQALKPAVEALRANNIKGAERIVTELMRPLYQPVSDGIEALTKLQMEEAKQEYAESMARYTNTRNISITAIAIGLALAWHWLHGSALY